MNSIASPHSTESNKGSSRGYLDRLSAAMQQLNCEEMDEALEVVSNAWQADRQVITLGNGGSALTALHMATDWSKGISKATGRRFRARSLLDNMGIVMAYGNDVSFEEVFTEQLRHILEPGDLVLAISGSGNSQNVISAMQYANENGGVTLGLCGFGGGKLREVAQHTVCVHLDDMQICEDVHSIFGHIVMQKLCGMA